MEKSLDDLLKENKQLKNEILEFKLKLINLTGDNNWCNYIDNKLESITQSKKIEYEKIEDEKIEDEKI